MGVYDRAIATAKRLIAKYGEVDQWKTQGGAQRDVNIAWFRPSDVGKGGLELFQAMAGTEVPTGMQVGLLAGGLDFTPNTVDTVYRQGVAQAIDKLDPIAPGGVVVLWFVTVLT